METAYFLFKGKHGKSISVFELNNSSLFRRYRYGRVGRGFQSLRSLMELARIVHSSGDSPKALYSFDYRVISILSINGKASELANVGTRTSWQMAGSNCLETAQQVN